MDIRTPYSERLHIAFVGRRNVGKSSLVNAISGQSVSIVSDIPGTTTDPVRKAIELPSLGACVLIDTAGLDDGGTLGSLRAEASARQIPESDVVVLVLAPAPWLDESSRLDFEEDCISKLKAGGTPYVVVLNKADGLVHDPVEELVERRLGVRPILVSAVEETGIGTLLDAILDKVPADFGRQSLLGGLVEAGDVVVLVMPQDGEAPKGRLIMPQTRVIRELMDRGCVGVNCTPETFTATLAALREAPDLVIVDSSVFKAIAPLVPEGSRLTSFSILMAAYKGDLAYFIEGAKAIDSLVPGSRVLIAESCSHVPAGEDIGRVKLPALLRGKVRDLAIDIVSGKDFPKDPGTYSLIIHCGGCVFSRKHLLSRVDAARRKGVPMTNYGIAIAHLTGVLPMVSLPQ